MTSLQEFKNHIRGFNINDISNNNNIKLQIVDWKTTDKEINNENSSIDEDDLEGNKQQDQEYNFEYLITLLSDSYKSLTIYSNSKFLKIFASLVLSQPSSSFMP